jgi:hypothetical protein
VVYSVVTGHAGVAELWWSPSRLAIRVMMVLGLDTHHQKRDEVEVPVASGNLLHHGPPPTRKLVRRHLLHRLRELAAMSTSIEVVSTCSCGFLSLQIGYLTSFENAFGLEMQCSGS